MKPPQLLDTNTAAERMNVAPSTIRSWVRKGWLKPVAKVGRKSWYWRVDLVKAERRARRGEDVAEAS